MNLPFEIDYVFPWVNDGDPVWRKTYEDYCTKTQSYLRLEQFHNERFRDWGLLKYIFRAIETNMPWIRKVHLIVSNKEQVPRWLDTTKVNIVLHEQIIPARYLPTFNSTAIEMFLDKIPDLAEHFLYGNDDMFPMNPSEPSDWYTEDGKPKFTMRTLDSKSIKSKQFPIVCSNQWWILEEMIKHKADKRTFKRPWHGLNPMIKSKCIEAKNLLGNDRIKRSISNFRQAWNFNQYIYMNYMFLTDFCAEPTYTFEYLGAKNCKMLELIRETTSTVICINDCASDLNDMQIAQLQVLTAEEFNKRFPNKSKFEKEII